MRIDRMTTKGQEAVRAAVDIASRRGNPELYPEHLLKAILEQEGGVGSPLVQKAGIDPTKKVEELTDAEVKAIREGRVNLRDSYARVEKGEVWLYNVNISSYSHRGYADHEPLRQRKLLMHRDEIRKLIGKTTEKGMTLVPLRMYFSKGRVKVAIGLAKGKKDYDKRETIKRRETERETRAAVKSRR